MYNRCSHCGYEYLVRAPKCPVCKKTGLVFENKPLLGLKLLDGGYRIHDTRLSEEK